MDLDNDGHKDLISGSWPGEIFFFKGTEDGSFAAPEMIKNKDGEFINIGGGIRPGGGIMGEILIAGYAKFEHTSEGTFVNYHGKRFKSTPEKPYAITGTASAAHAVDWDGDGDYDLIVGSISGNVYLLPNEGTLQSCAFGKEEQLRAGGRPINVRRGAGPFTAEWDGDADLDLLVGADDGSVSLYRNAGSTQSPK
ncbi:MAG: VCBS repeat-containing protein, partial [Phycisphaerales bacterium]